MTDAPDVRLAWGGPPEAQASGLGPSRDGLGEPALLVSFFYLDQFIKQRRRYGFRTWALDSGAFSAANSGQTINHTRYLETCRQLLTQDPQLVEVFSLDVIGDWRASMKAVERAWSEGVPAIPTYHTGEPEDVLRVYARDYPKISLGGSVGLSARKKLAWAQQCFSRVWPAKIHGLGCGGDDLILGVPFHSTDATNWEMGPCAFGRWRTYGNMSVRGGNQNLRSEVAYYLRLERKARHKWRREMARLERIAVEQRHPRLDVPLDLQDTEPRQDGDATNPTVRLAVAAGGGGTIVRTAKAIPRDEQEPTA